MVTRLKARSTGLRRGVHHRATSQHARGNQATWECELSEVRSIGVSDEIGRGTPRSDEVRTTFSMCLMPSSAANLTFSVDREMKPHEHSQTKRDRRVGRTRRSR